MGKRQENTSSKRWLARLTRMPWWPWAAPTSALRSGGNGGDDFVDSSPDTGGAFRCPLCSAPMALKVVRTGPMIGKRFWGCGQYALTQCRGTRELD
jgi:hypothetical protein